MSPFNLMYWHNQISWIANQLAQLLNMLWAKSIITISKDFATCHFDLKLRDQIGFQKKQEETSMPFNQGWLQNHYYQLVCTQMGYARKLCSD